MDEKSLVLRFKKGDQGAFELLVKLHYRAVYAMAFRYMGEHAAADDVVQESFLKAHKAIKNFRGDSSFKSWVIRIAINTAKNILRSKKRVQNVAVDENTLVHHHREFKNLDHSESAKLLRWGIEELPPKQRTALELRIFESMSFKEVAEAMECPFDTAKANFRHALFNLRKIFNSQSHGRNMEELRIALESFKEDDEE